MNKINLINKFKLACKYPKLASNLALLSIYQRLQEYPNFNFPKYTTLFVTEKCNLYCSMCLVGKTRDAYKKSPELEIEDWKRIIAELRLFNPIVYVTGGEPLLNRNIFSILDEIEKFRFMDKSDKLKVFRDGFLASVLK